MEKELRLPPIYKRLGRECYLDPIRQKLIYVTPEETVRQEIITYLTEILEVPSEMIAVEEPLSHYGIKTRKRADIIIHTANKEDEIVPIAVIECKAPKVDLDDRAKNQLLEYCDIIYAKYAMLTNGIDQISFRFNEEKRNYDIIEKLPKYSDILEDKFIIFDPGEYPERIPFEELEKVLKEGISLENYISYLTPMNLAVPMFNLLEGLLDYRVKMPAGNYGLFRLIEDYGVRMLSYGNASGGHFYGPYRSFLVECDGNTEFYSIAVTTYWKSTSPDNIKTCIVVAHDEEERTHHALQLVVDENLETYGNKIDFYHNGKIAVGRMGSGKISELRQFVEDRYPKLINGNKFYLGSLINDRLWRMDDPDVIELIVNLISYSMIRDEYREYVKQKRSQKTNNKKQKQQEVTTWKK